MSKLLQGDALLDRARELGVSVYANSTPSNGGAAAAFNAVATEAEIQKRVIDAELRILARRTWWSALASAIASALSAAAALVAIYYTRGP